MRRRSTKPAKTKNELERPSITDRLRILFVMGSLYNASSGPYRSLKETAEELQSLGHFPTIVGSRDKWRQDPPQDWNGIPACALRKVGPYSLHFTPGIRRWLNSFKTGFDAASFQSVWQYNNYLASLWCRERAIPYMITVHGNLNPRALEISGWKKRLVRKWYVDEMLENAACFQALTPTEYRAIREYGIKTPVCLIPNGIRLPESESALIQSSPFEKFAAGRKAVLYLGRLHALKNLSSLIKAWSNLGALKKDWILVLAGPDDGGCRAELERDAAKLGLLHDVLFLGSVHKEEKAACFRQASCLVLPSLSEGFAVTLLEAMSYRLPTLYTRECNFSEIDASNAGIETESSPDSLKRGLEKMLLMSDSERGAMGLRGYELVKEKYQWSRIAQELVGIYLWLSKGASPPQSVIFD